METAYFEGFDSGPKARSIPARASGPRQLSKPKNALRAESPIPLVCDGPLALKSKKRLAICTARTYLHLKTCVKSTSLGQTPTVVFGTTNLESRIKGANFAFTPLSIANLHNRLRKQILHGLTLTIHRHIKRPLFGFEHRGRRNPQSRVNGCVKV